jgi:protein-disulfide isomerase
MTLSRRSLLTLTSSLAALAASGVWAEDTATTPAPAAEAAAPATTPAPAPTADTVQDFTLGRPDAKVKIVEYLSFTCPHCERFHAEVFPQLKADYIDKGLVNVTYHEVYFDQMGLLGAMLARCGGEMRYFGITDMLYDKQRDWAGAADINAAVAQLKVFGRTAGMDDATVDACLRDQKVAEALVAHYQANIAKDYPNDSFKGTPSSIINGAQYANMAYEDMKKIIDAELAK